ncbi:MAG: hypothetical protein Q4C87_10825 [Actinomycetaceae bacterium]|nr:hypothetical protein [Actinomycetaceae bacterium]
MEDGSVLTIGVVSAALLSEAEVEQRIAEALKSAHLLGAAGKYQHRKYGEMPIRVLRRIVGDYQLTEMDMPSGGLGIPEEYRDASDRADARKCWRFAANLTETLAQHLAATYAGLGEEAEIPTPHDARERGKDVLFYCPQGWYFPPSSRLRISLESHGLQLPSDGWIIPDRLTKERGEKESINQTVLKAIQQL